MSKDSLNRHAQKRLPQELEDSPATATAGINSTEKGGCAEIAQKKDEEPEARQLAEVVEQKKEPDPWALWSPAEPEAVQTEKTPKKEPDAEVLYRAFIEHWRDRQAVRQHEPSEWSFENVEELIETAIGRGDLMVLGSLYVRTIQL